jgi:hypothetical protein
VISYFQNATICMINGSRTSKAMRMIATQKNDLRPAQETADCFEEINRDVSDCLAADISIFLTSNYQTTPKN